VRFREPGTARGLVISGLRHALAEEGHRASSTIADATLGAFKKSGDINNSSNFLISWVLQEHKFTKIISFLRLLMDL